MKKINSQKGFTLLELIVAIGVFTIIISTAVMSTSAYISRNQLSTAKSQVLNALHSAKLNSMTGFHDGDWGVYFDESNNEITLFQGSSYSLRDKNLDQLYTFPSSMNLYDVVLTGSGDYILFDDTSGETTQDGAFKIENNQNAYKFTVNNLGHVTVE